MDYMKKRQILPLAESIGILLAAGGRLLSRGVPTALLAAGIYRTEI
jgi:hypothetical protein